MKAKPVRTDLPGPKSRAAKPGTLNAKGVPVGTTVRPGQKKPYRKCTQAEKEVRVEYCAVLLRNGFTRTQVHAKMLDKFGITWSATDQTYVPSARKWLRDRTSMTADQARAKGLDILFRVLETGTPRERIAAETRIAEVYGYNAPRRTEVAATVTEQAPLPPLSKERLEELVAAGKLAEQSFQLKQP